jgi:hypothetical protein
VLLHGIESEPDRRSRRLVFHIGDIRFHLDVTDSLSTHVINPTHRFPLMSTVSTSHRHPCATAVVLNATAVDYVPPGFLTLYPAAHNHPLCANVNFVAADRAQHGDLAPTPTGSVRPQLGGHTLPRPERLFHRIRVLQVLPDGTDNL